MKKIILAASGICFFIAACNNQPKEEATQAEKQYKGVETANMDPTVSPCIDFYQYANGAWLTNNPIPETESRWGSFHEVRDRNNDILKKILEDATNNADAAQGSNTQKIGDFYFCAMDSAKLNADGITPLRNEFDIIANIKNTDDLITAIAHYHSQGIWPLFKIDIDQDAKQSTQYTTYFGQGGLGLPDRDYYLRDDAKSTQIRVDYNTLVTKMFELLGELPEDASENAKTVIEIETQLAKASMTRVETRDIENIYNKRTAEEFKTATPNINWNAYFDKTGINISEMVVNQPLFFEEINTMVNSTTLNDWKTYLNWYLINSTANKLSSDFENQSFWFYSTILRGIPKIQPRWKRVLKAANSSLGQIIGQEFVRTAFSEESKQRVNEMVDNLFAEFGDRIKTLDWMSEETQKQAQKKLSTVTRKMGYPDKWLDYSSLEINRDSYVTNWLQCNKFEFKRQVNKLGQPIDENEWHMPPQTVNAYYNPLMNEIAFPAGILQPPFFNPEADDAVNYGSMGAVIGHEFTHGFDDQGSKFDSEGNVNNWWTDQDKENFMEKAQLIVEQFNNYEALDSLFVNGQLTLGENIADLGGVSISFAAYQRSLEGKEQQAIDGFTPEQRFFIAYGQVWKNNYRPEALRQLVLTNPHSPSHFRVIGPLSNFPAFHEAFGCSEGEPMVRADSTRAKIW
ncbi:MAG: peptidase M13 [Flavobacteriales bacterium]|nr:MAG: peptidase M13 [Flavobacteriales bacterium]